MKILLISHYYPPHVGGMELVAKYQATHLAKLGHRVTVVTSKVGKSEQSRQEEGVSVIRVPALNLFEKRWGVPFPIFSPRLIPTLMRAARESDVVHVHDAFYISSLVGVLCATWYRKPVVLMQHVEMIKHPSALIMFAQRLVYVTTGLFIFRSSEKILTLNDRVEQFILGKGVASSKLIPFLNGVDPEVFHPVSPEEKRQLKTSLGLSPDKKVVLFVGRFVPKKGFHTLLALPESGYQLLFCGGVKPMGAPKHAFFVGSLPHKETARVYQAADLFVLPSEGEGFPLSVQEAMASGLPVITTDDAGYARYGFDRKRIELLNDLSVHGIELAIQAVINDKERMESMATYSRDYAVQHFSWNTVIKELERIYKEMVSRQHKAVLVTTSWDDGHQLDLRMASLLKKYGLHGTFYISPFDREISPELRLSEEQIKQLAKDFEIGAHTMTHPRLPLVSASEAEKEIRESRTYLQHITGQPVKAFCYPRGEYRAEHVPMVDRAGFSYARTVERHVFSVRPPLQTATTIHCYDHWLDVWKVLIFSKFNPLTFLRMYRHWDVLALAMFERVRKEGGVFHLWGHSWEIDGHKDWERLERVMQAIGGKDDIQYVPNSLTI